MLTQEKLSEPTGFRIVYFTAADLGMASLVGINGEPPFAFGNYFSFLNPDNRDGKVVERLNGPRVVNMWYENLKHLFRTDIERVRVLVFGSAPEWIAFVDDDKVPVEYLNKELYCVAHSPKYLEAVKAYSGLPIR